MLWGWDDDQSGAGNLTTTGTTATDICCRDDIEAQPHNNVSTLGSPASEKKCRPDTTVVKGCCSAGIKRPGQDDCCPSREVTAVETELKDPDQQESERGCCGDGASPVAMRSENQRQLCSSGWPGRKTKFDLASKEGVGQYHLSMSVGIQYQAESSVDRSKETMCPCCVQSMLTTNSKGASLPISGSSLRG
jgi:hypothetical protein